MNKQAFTQLTFDLLQTNTQLKYLVEKKIDYLGFKQKQLNDLEAEVKTNALSKKIYSTNRLINDLLEEITLITKTIHSQAELVQYSDDLYEQINDSLLLNEKIYKISEGVNVTGTISEAIGYIVAEAEKLRKERENSQRHDEKIFWQANQARFSKMGYTFDQDVGISKIVAPELISLVNTNLTLQNKELPYNGYDASVKF
jgi:hypothetical protein